mgnify:CR=1 FL=1
MKRPCTTPGCPALVVVPARTCTQHEHRKRSPLPKAPSNPIYGTGRWKAARLAFLRLHPYCVECGQPATIVDHVVPHKGDAGLFWASTNWQPLCVSHHSTKTAREDGGFGNPTRTKARGG